MTENIVLEVNHIDSFVVDIQLQHRMPKGFAILAYNVGCVFSKEYNSIQYELFYGDNAKGNKIISRGEAMSLIAIHNLEKVIDNTSGRVWE